MSTFFSKTLLISPSVITPIILSLEITAVTPYILVEISVITSSILDSILTVGILFLSIKSSTLRFNFLPRLPDG